MKKVLALLCATSLLVGCGVKIEKKDETKAREIVNYSEDSLYSSEEKQSLNKLMPKAEKIFKDNDLEYVLLKGDKLDVTFVSKIISSNEDDSNYSTKCWFGLDTVDEVNSIKFYIESPISDEAEGDSIYKIIKSMSGITNGDSDLVSDLKDVFETFSQEIGEGILFEKNYSKKSIALSYGDGYITSEIVFKIN